MPELVPATASRRRSIRQQHKAIAAALIRAGASARPARLEMLSRAAGRPVPAFADLGFAEATVILIRLGLEAGRRGRD